MSDVSAVTYQEPLIEKPQREGAGNTRSHSTEILKRSLKASDEQNTSSLRFIFIWPNVSTQHPHSGAKTATGVV